MYLTCQHRTTLTKTPALQHSVNAAHKAIVKGGSVKVGKTGNLEVTGKTFIGRAIRHLKIRLFPDKVCQQNHVVIAALNRKIWEDFGPDHQLNIKATVTSAASHRRFLQSIINSVSNIRADSGYAAANSTRDEALNTLKHGFASKITAQKLRQEQPGPPGVETENSRLQLFLYNQAMDDLFHRYPKLRYIPAIKILKLDKPYKDTLMAQYYRYNSSIYLGSTPLDKASREVRQISLAGNLTPKQDFSGIIHHEYAHHLSLHVVPRKRWLPGLVDALREGGMKTHIKRNIFGPETFDQHTAGRIANSVSKYAATDVDEFAAEVLSWYMNPEYGKTVAPMPDFLENWVRECFPMLSTES